MLNKNNKNIMKTIHLKNNKLNNPDKNIFSFNSSIRYPLLRHACKTSHSHFTIPMTGVQKNYV